MSVREASTLAIPADRSERTGTYGEGVRSIASLRTLCRADLSGDARERFDIVARTFWQLRQTGSGVKSPQ
jgi:hypothetical protein